MTDMFTPEERSRVMSLIRSKHTRPERCFAALLRAHGIRFRRHVRTLPGSPDFVFHGRRLAVFLHGCFWHGHLACGKGARPPKTRAAFWRAKIARNRERDVKATRLLRDLAWSVFTFWECELSAVRLPPRLLTRLGLAPGPPPARPSAASKKARRKSTA